ncbi:unnamed protein product, partial [Ectocarpus fasciculatus]
EVYYYSHRDDRNCAFVTATACEVSTASRTAVACTCAIRRRLCRYNHATRIRVVDSATRNAPRNTTPARFYLRFHATFPQNENPCAQYGSSTLLLAGLQHKHSFPQSHTPMSRAGHLGFLPTTHYSLSPLRMTTTATTRATRVATCSLFRTEGPRKLVICSEGVMSPAPHVHVGKQHSCEGCPRSCWYSRVPRFL